MQTGKSGTHWNPSGLLEYAVGSGCHWKHGECDLWHLVCMEGPQLEEKKTGRSEAWFSAVSGLLGAATTPEILGIDHVFSRHFWKVHFRSKSCGRIAISLGRVWYERSREASFLVPVEGLLGHRDHINYGHRNHPFGNHPCRYVISRSDRP